MLTNIPPSTRYVKRYSGRRFAPIPLSPEGDSPLGATIMGGMMAGMMGCEWCPLAVYNPENGWNPCGRGYGTVECQDDVKAWLLADAIAEAEKGE
jgi:hypothetical protein